MWYSLIERLRRYSHISQCWNSLTLITFQQISINLDARQLKPLMIARFRLALTVLVAGALRLTVMMLPRRPRRAVGQLSRLPVVRRLHRKLILRQNRRHRRHAAALLLRLPSPMTSSREWNSRMVTTMSR